MGKPNFQNKHQHLVSIIRYLRFLHRGQYISNPNILSNLGGGWTNPIEKYDRQIGSFPQKIGVKFQKIFETTTQL